MGVLAVLPFQHTFRAVQRLFEGVVDDDLTVMWIRRYTATTIRQLIVQFFRPEHATEHGFVAELCVYIRRQPVDFNIATDHILFGGTDQCVERVEHVFTAHLIEGTFVRVGFVERSQACATTRFDWL